MDEETERLLDHAWRHFAFHAQQRTTVFNFFTASAGLTLTGLFYVLGSPAAPRMFGLAAGIGAALLSLVFWKLDQRVIQLIKEGEQVLISIEQALPNPMHRLFERAEGLKVNIRLSPLKSTWSYGRSFRLMFLIVAVTGLVGAGAALRSALSPNQAPPGRGGVAPIAEPASANRQPIAVGAAISTRTQSAVVARSAETLHASALPNSECKDVGPPAAVPALKASCRPSASTVK